MTFGRRQQCSVYLVRGRGGSCHVRSASRETFNLHFIARVLSGSCSTRAFVIMVSLYLVVVSSHCVFCWFQKFTVRDIDGRDVRHLRKIRSASSDQTVSFAVYDFDCPSYADVSFLSGCAANTKGTAFVVYEDIFDAKNACEHLSGFNVCNRYLVVLYYQPHKVRAKSGQ